jgi:shikimate kinase
MGSGKSTVGALLARELGWGFVDVDREVEARTGRSIAGIFRDDGEESFRAIEGQVAGEFLDGDHLVLATGGGWPCREGRLESVGPATLSIWLRVTGSDALRRVSRHPGKRPLLAVPQPKAEVDRLLEEREPYYGRAAWWIETGNRLPKEIVRLVIDRLATDPERPLRA